MKAFLVAAAAALVVLASAEENSYLPPSRGSAGGRGGGGGYPSGGPGGDENNEPANYEFSYEVQDAESGNDFGHKENRQGDVATGMYHVLLPDGRTQLVDYVADKDGYKPQVKYEGEANAAAGGYDYKTPAGGARGFF